MEMRFALPFSHSNFCTAVLHKHHFWPLFPSRKSLQPDQQILRCIMVTLAQIPSEILSIVSSSLNGFDIAHLWLSGDRMLIVRLENGGVTRIKLALAQTVNCLWPKFISRFKRLETLIVIRRSRNHHIWFRGVDYAGIAPTLKHLELEFENLEFSLLGLPFVVSDAHPDPIWSPPTEGEMLMSPLPLSTYFPLLETVIFRANMKFPQFLVPLLPAGLLTLSLPCTHMDTHTLQHLPPNLTHLELPYLKKTQISEKFLPLPSSLIYLNLQAFDLVNNEQASCLPLSLTHLNINLKPNENSTDTPIVLQLPPMLVHLIVPGWSTHPNTLSFSMTPSLLHLETIQRTIPFSLKSLPSRLQSLSAFQLRGLSSVTMSQLPSSLTHLHIRSTRFPAARLFDLPPSIRVLTLNIDFVDAGTPYSFMSSLEALDIAQLDASALAYAPKLRNLNMIAFLVPQTSPPSLKHLPSLGTLSISSLAPMEEVPLPPGLTDLGVPSLSPECFVSLPRGLQSLRIARGNSDWGDLVAHLPPSLTKLIVYGGGQNGVFSDASIALLPSSLESIVLATSNTLTDKGIANLPRNLRGCCLGTAPLVTDASASLFPRQLTLLELSSPLSLTNAFVKHLPRTLTGLSFPGTSQFTKECVGDLPPRLVRFSCTIGTPWNAVASKTEDFLLKLQETQQQSVIPV